MQVFGLCRFAVLAQRRGLRNVSGVQLINGFVGAQGFVSKTQERCHLAV
ncbi:hypothetical protein ALO43_200605 [Pseudomonas tremae]|uniref:Uncharacterized protein n=1 Tax=Pseudomonas tremae TaxID=200454 RepID=A0AA40P0B7_9PSED|nr:hypothetical protein ALO43_200605 [Pseudomonas tremae]